MPNFIPTTSRLASLGSTIGEGLNQVTRPIQQGLDLLSQQKLNELNEASQHRMKQSKIAQQKQALIRNGVSPELAELAVSFEGSPQANILGNLNFNQGVNQQGEQQGSSGLNALGQQGPMDNNLFGKKPSPIAQANLEERKRANNISEENQRQNIGLRERVLTETERSHRANENFKMTKQEQDLIKDNNKATNERIDSEHTISNKLKSPIQQIKKLIQNPDFQYGQLVSKFPGIRNATTQKVNSLLNNLVNIISNGGTDRQRAAIADAKASIENNPEAINSIMNDLEKTLIKIPEIEFSARNQAIKGKNKALNLSSEIAKLSDEKIAEVSASETGNYVGQRLKTLNNQKASKFPEGAASNNDNNTYWKVVNGEFQLFPGQVKGRGK